jgi:hypothetical protein
VFKIKTYHNFVNEYYEESFEQYIPYMEEILNVKIDKVLGESVGLAYLTTDNRVVKVTSIDNEYNIAKALIKNPNKYFPKIYEVEPLLGDDWIIILKEFVPEASEKDKKNLEQIEKLLEDFFDSYEYESLMCWLLEESKDTLFFDLLEDEYAHLIPLYKDLMSMVEYTNPIAKNKVIDIHADNLGYRDGNFVLFDW